MKNKLRDLNDHLFAQIERLGEENLTEEQINKEAGRAEAMVKVADKIIANGNLALQASKHAAEYGLKPSLPMLGLDEKNNA